MLQIAHSVITIGAPIADVTTVSNLHLFILNEDSMFSKKKTLESVRLENKTSLKSPLPMTDSLSSMTPPLYQTTNSDLLTSSSQHFNAKQPTVVK